MAQQLARSLKGRKVELVPTEHAGHAEILAYDIAKKYKQPLIISSSGDGGYHEVVNGAMRAQDEGETPVCAVLPAGNANDHHHATDRAPLETSIQSGSIIKMDLLRVDMKEGKKQVTRYGHSYLGLGLTPTVAVELNRHTLSAFREMMIVVRSFYEFRPFKIEVEGNVLELDSLIISHIGRMAKVLSFDASDLDDGVFEVTLLPHGHKLRLLSKLIGAATRGLRADISAKEYSFKAVKAMPMQIDGEISQLKRGAIVRVTGSKQALSTLR